MAYSGGRGYFGSGRYVEESRENRRGNCDSGRKIEVATGVDKLDISEKTAEVSSQGKEEMGCKDVMEKTDGNADIVGFTENKERESMGVFNKFDKESVERAEEYLDKLEGAIELEEEGGDIVEMFDSKVQVRVHLGSVAGDREGGVHVFVRFEVSLSPD